MNHNGSVALIWQRLEEIGKVMMTYGSLMARRNRLKSDEQRLLDAIPVHPSEMITHIKEKLGYEG